MPTPTSPSPAYAGTQLRTASRVVRPELAGPSLSVLLDLVLARRLRAIFVARRTVPCGLPLFP